MIRTDGDFTIYVLQFRETTKKGGEWFSPSFDSFGTPPGFGASGDCWQQLGLHATFDEAEAFDALRAFAEAYPESDWRMMEVKLSQQHTERAAISAKKPGKRFDHPYPPTKEYRRRIEIVQRKVTLRNRLTLPDESNT